MGGLSIVNLVWWGIGGAAVLVGLGQLALALAGPRERRGTAVIGVLVVLVGGLAFAMPFFGEGDAPPARPRPDATGTTPATGLTPWTGVAFGNLMEALPRESFRLEALLAEIISRLDAGTLSDADLAALYAGLFRATELVRLGLVEASNSALECADRLFSGSEPWMSDRF